MGAPSAPRAVTSPLWHGFRVSKRMIRAKLLYLGLEDGVPAPLPSV